MRFLFVDRILSDVNQCVRGLKHITYDDYYLTHDSDNARYCFIPSLMGETLGQLAAWHAMAANDFTQRPVAGVVSMARVHRPAYVGETLLLEAHIDNLDETSIPYHGVVRVKDEVVFTLEGALGPMLPMQDFISKKVVQRQWQEINRPGDAPVFHSSSIDDYKPKDYRSCPPMTFDHILSNEPGVKIVAQKLITRAAAYFPDHFPRKPVLPLTVLLECQMNLVRYWLQNSDFATDFQIYALRKIKMNAFVMPGEIVTCCISVKQLTENEVVLMCRCEVAALRVCVLEIVLKKDGSI